MFSDLLCIKKNKKSAKISSRITRHFNIDMDRRWKWGDGIGVMGVKCFLDHFASTAGRRSNYRHRRN